MRIGLHSLGASARSIRNPRYPAPSRTLVQHQIVQCSRLHGNENRRKRNFYENAIEGGWETFECDTRGIKIKMFEKENVLQLSRLTFCKIEKSV